MISKFKRSVVLGGVALLAGLGAVTPAAGIPANAKPPAAPPAAETPAAPEAPPVTRIVGAAAPGISSAETPSTAGPAAPVQVPAAAVTTTVSVPATPAPGVAAVDAAATPAPVAPVAPPVMAEPAPEPVAVPKGEPEVLIAAALPYARLREDVTYADETAITAAKITRESHKRLSSYDPAVMGRSLVAYVALVAADHPRFAAAIDARTDKPKRREAFIASLRENPASIRDLDGADEAINAILDVMARDAVRLQSVGDRYIADAYRLQAAGWAKSKLPTGGMVRVKEAQSFAAARPAATMPPLAPAASEAGNLRPNLAGVPMWSPGWSLATASPQLEPAAGSVMTRALVLAAYYAAGDMNPAYLDEFAKSPATDKCMSRAKLNFDQCIAATRTSYEEAFCIGTHGLHDVSRCIGWAAQSGFSKAGAETGE